MSVVMVDGQAVTVPDGPDTLDTNFPHIEEIQSKFGEALINTPKGKRGHFFSLDPGGAFGTRQAAIEEASKNYKPGQGFELGSNTWGLGITQQDVANYYMTQYQDARKNTEVGKYGATYFPEGQKPHAATSQLQLTKKVGEFKDIAKLTTKIRNTDRGTALLKEFQAKNGRKPTVAELETLATTATNNTRSAVQERKSAEATIDLTKAKTDEIPKASQRADDSIAIQQGTLDLNRTTAANTQAINLAKLDLADRMAKYQHEIAQITQRNQMGQADKDRDLRRDLALLTRSDNAAERAYNRERDERKDRQLMILQLMKGLGSLGQSIAI